MSRDRGVEARGRGETEAFENSFEARSKRGVGRPRGGLETEAPRPRPHPYCVASSVRRQLVYRAVEWRYLYCGTQKWVG